MALLEKLCIIIIVIIIIIATVAPPGDASWQTDMYGGRGYLCTNRCFGGVLYAGYESCVHDMSCLLHACRTCSLS